MSSKDETDQRRPFIEASSSSSNVIQEPPRRTGNVVSAAAHIITGVIGAGVLSLAWSIAQLGWLAGPLCILIFAVIIAFSSSLLSDCYRFPLPHGPVRNPSLMHAVKLYLGGKREVVCGVLVKIYLVGTSTAYVITSASSASSRYSMMGSDGLLFWVWATMMGWSVIFDNWAKKSQLLNLIQYTCYRSF